MNQSITAAAYTTLQILDMAPKGAEYNENRYSWSFEATEDEFTAVLTALRSDAARKIQTQMESEKIRKNNRRTSRKTNARTSR